MSPSSQLAWVRRSEPLGTRPFLRSRTWPPSSSTPRLSLPHPRGQRRGGGRSPLASPTDPPSGSREGEGADINSISYQFRASPHCFKFQRIFRQIDVVRRGTSGNFIRCMGRYFSVKFSVQRIFPTNWRELSNTVLLFTAFFLIQH